MSAGNLPLIPAVFEARKTKILDELSVPEAEYTDRSPKGSVDKGVRDLIREINALPGMVTTSSCSGRISVFLEGRKKSSAPLSGQRQFVPSGGKGTGRWLYVSHDPLVRSEGDDASGKPLHRLFGMVPGDGRPPSTNRGLRLVRFLFEPLILHIMTATLSHAQPVLAAATASGFRESGLQSLRCLEGDEGPSPIVAVRSSGLSLESVIGYCDDEDDNAPDGPVIHSLVTEEYLQMLVAISNERFDVNTERRERFRVSLIEACSPRQSDSAMGRPGDKLDWEDAAARRERKRAEGLARKRLLEGQKKTTGPAGQDSGEMYAGFNDLEAEI